jgi:putative cardiolipin synthase
MVAAAQRSLDIQYYIFVEDATGKVLTKGVLDAANRGVRVRILIDDLNLYRHPETRATLAALDHHRNIEIRLFNPMSYRGDDAMLHTLDLTLNAPRLNHRMHNKLFVADGAIAIVGGRNVADGYFEAGDAAIRFGDFDLAVVGPVVAALGRSFDEFWNSTLAIPQPALPAYADGTTRAPDEAPADPALLSHLDSRIASGEPLRGMLSARPALAWGRSSVVADPPEKAAGEVDGDGSPTDREIHKRLATVRRDLVIISPYFVPGDDGLAALRRLLAEGVRVRVLTNSLASTDVPMVHSAYRRYRAPLLESGAEIYEIRPVPGQSPHEHGVTGSGGSGASRAPFALHAKAFVFDDQSVFLGSANLDPRSRTLNTEVGLVVDSPELAAQIVDRFDRFANAANSYRVNVDAAAAGAPLTWSAQIDGRLVQWHEEPDTTPEQRLKVDMLSVLPLEPLL